MFFRELVSTLNSENRYWRHTTVILLDNAPYHASNYTLGVFKELSIPVMFLGPYSYDAAPCELFYAWFKSDDINPRKLP